VKVLVTGGSGLVGRHIVDALSRDREVANLDINPSQRGNAPFIKADVLDLEALREKTRGFDAVVHLAGIPHPLNEPGEKVFRVNVMGTFNMLEAALQNGIRKFVLMSSESTLGFAFSSQRTWPEYLPVDESHPLRPQDPYGLSKVACELLCAGFSRRSMLATVCLRSPWIWVPEPGEAEMYRRLVKEYDQWPKNLWAYIHVADVAQAIRLALDSPLPVSHEVCFICANENWTDIDSRDLVKRFYPEIPVIAESFTKRASFITNEKARRILGFSPRFSRTDILGNSAYSAR
jgi:nucleoside-diphosphate-sugar epimerase